MKLSKISIHNFRRLESVEIDVDARETIYVGPNNSGKTSATAIFRCFLGERNFKIYDFSVARIADFNKFVDSEDITDLPEIILDLWFDIDPDTIAFGRVFTLLPKLSDFTSVGLRLSYSVEDSRKLYEQYSAAYPVKQDGVRAKTLFQYLATDNNLGRHWTVRYASLEEKLIDGKGIEIFANPLEVEEGRRLVKHLIKVEFVDAQRNINDDDSSRSNRLSSAFTSYYKKNLEQKEYAEEAYKVIDNNNKQLTQHYKTQFQPLIDLIKELGIPSVNDRELQIVSSLSPETALRGNTELLYVDSWLEHELPELYNGLGFKNLIFMAIQVKHFHSQWLQTLENRPLCLFIFIEEPEVHLHAQVQQTFITNIWNVIAQTVKTEQPDLVPQLVVTTHSSHILDAVDFEKVRHFQRCPQAGEAFQKGIYNTSVVRSLRTFQPEVDMVDGKVISIEESLAFLKRYLRLTHCDLFFADAAILVEGAVEKLLMPSIIAESANQLRSTYLTILEVGGAYAYRFEKLLKFLCIPYLVITDLDSVQPEGRLTACRADLANARTSNESLKKLCGKNTVSELIAMSASEKINNDQDRCVAFQTDVTIIENNMQFIMRPRTLEEAIAYENFTLIREGKLSIGINFSESLEHAYNEIYNRIYDHIRSNSFKKTDFAMSLLASDVNWITPAYIREGLYWLESRLCEQNSIGQANGAQNIRVPAI